MEKLLNDLSLINAASGDEAAVREYIKSTLADINCEINTDNLGNLIVFKKGRKKALKTIALFAHMDEVAFIVQGINSNGFISLAAVGGVSDSVVYGRRIKFSNGIYGVIGGKPIHHVKGDEKKEQPKLSSLYADIGAVSKTCTEKYVALGDYAYFDSDYIDFGAGLIKGKALDDRVGCAVMLDIILSDLEYDTHFIFTAQEEVGARGGMTAAYSLKPDYAVILETTTACDIAGVEGDKKVCNLGEGTVIPFMDRGTVYNRELYDLAFETAAENHLKCQTKTQIAGGNDSSTVHKTADGIRSVCLAVPCRYLHTPNCVINKKDLFEMRVLTEKLINKIAQL